MRHGEFAKDWVQIYHLYYRVRAGFLFIDQFRIRVSLNVFTRETGLSLVASERISSIEIAQADPRTRGLVIHLKDP
jgi:hypothetical protein